MKCGPNSEVMENNIIDLNNKVVLMEGTRKVPDNQKNELINFTIRLSCDYPNAIFRSGNAAGSDELIAQGVESIDAN